MKMNRLIFSILIILALIFSVGIYINYYRNSAKIDNSSYIFTSSKKSTTVQWLNNPNFSSSPIQPKWYWTSSGDKSDVVAREGNGCAEMKVKGDIRKKVILANPPNSSEWKNVTNPEFPVLPMGNDGPGGNPGIGIDSEGCWASHTWDEDGPSGEIGQTPSVHWEKNITMPVNMSDYIITSASVKAIVNATVKQDIDCPGDTSSGGSNGVVHGAVYDYVRFYVLISDLSRVKKYEIAYNKTKYLGLGNSVSSDSEMPDTYLITVPEEVLIFYLTSVLESDNYNFRITLGIFIYCEDDDIDYELDTWTILRIKYFNLTFTYEKKINQGTTIAWSQTGNKLPTPPPNGSITIDEARLYFKYKIDGNWASGSPNSEIRVFINNKQHIEAIKLSNAGTSFQEANPKGFDVTSLISINENITPTIQIYLADNFGLGNNITISIDDVVLWITYTIFTPETPTQNTFNWWFIVIPLIVALVALASVFIAYQYHFKIPRIIRIIRKLKRNISKGKETSPLDLKMRQETIGNLLKNQVKPLDIKLKNISENLSKSKKN
ncbi:MAG: hypothetical protein ACTSPQ_17595 [Candidatus Helarchaeota archaeon]